MRSPRRAVPAIVTAPHSDCVAIIDIGSNSLRLVLYDGVRRSARMLLNEKVLCGLGRGLEESSHLNPEGVELAKSNLQRFVALARAARAARIDVLATAAVRDADDGRDFVADIERRFNIRVRVLSGNEEGRMSALGVLAGIPDAVGVSGDLGGGSVELAPIVNARVGSVATLPIGPLRLAGIADDEKRLKDAIDRHLGAVPWLAEAPDSTFYAVGGAWRAIARIHMEQAGYPLHIIQHYTLSRSEAQSFLDLVARQSRKSLEKISTIARKRLEVVPLAARILNRIMRRIGSKQLVFSAGGLREGHLYSLMDSVEQRSDPLIAACIDAARFDPRFGADGDELFAWIGPLFPKEPAPRQRLRRAAALLGDIGWRDHPDYRADQALRYALYMPVAGIDHRERAFLATILYSRYGGNMSADLPSPLQLLDEDALDAARAIGLALRLGYTLSGGVPGMLSGSALKMTDNTVVLNLPAESAKLYGESVQRRLEALGRTLDRRAELRLV